MFVEVEARETIIQISSIFEANIDGLLIVLTKCVEMFKDNWFGINLHNNDFIEPNISGAMRFVGAFSVPRLQLWDIFFFQF